MRQIIPAQNLVFLDDNDSYTVDCAALVARKIGYVGEDHDGLWIELVPFSGRLRVFDAAPVQLIFFRADTQRNTPPPPDTLASARTRRNAEISALRDERIAEGLPHAFPAQAGTIQLRNPIDISNILGVSAAGLALMMTGDTDTLVDFRDSEDHTHQLTGQQVVVMGLAVSQFIGAQYAAAWAHKDALANLFSLPEINAYDTATGWPA